MPRLNYWSCSLALSLAAVVASTACIKRTAPPPAAVGTTTATSGGAAAAPQSTAFVDNQPNPVQEAANARVDFDTDPNDFRAAQLEVAAGARHD